jgi:tetratricopeptide (TPR) repeat protein
MAVKPKLCVAVALAASVIATGCMMPATFDEDFANMAVEKKDYPKAIADAKQATALFPSRGTAWETLGVAYYFNNQNDEAITALRKAEELGRNGGGLLTPFPESYLERTYYFLGASYLKKGDNSEAIAWLGKALQLAPANAITHNDLGNAYFFEGQNEKAAAEYKRDL